MQRRRRTSGRANGLKPLLRATGPAGNLTTDAHLAALALSHDAVLVSSDADFARFKGLRVENPCKPVLGEFHRTRGSAASARRFPLTVHAPGGPDQGPISLE